MIEPERIERIEQRQQATDSKLGELVSAVSTLAESHRLAQEEQKQERLQYRADHKATHDAIQRLSVSTTEALSNIRDRIGQGREFKWGPTLGIISLVWGVSLVVVGWGSRQEATNLVNQTKLDVRESYIREVIVPRFESIEEDLDHLDDENDSLRERTAKLEVRDE